jgi:predicted NBD/HSP70 family sugar kinase
VEVGGSSAQSARRDASGRFWFTPGVVREPGRAIALACPGIVRDGRILYATNLGWPDEADPGRELGLDSVRLVVNDAVAAALGESVLRGGNSRALNLVYVSLGTGVGGAQVVNGVPSNLDLNHRYVGGTTYCAGCRGRGCLKSMLCSQSLPGWLTREDQAFVAQTLVSALEGLAAGGRTLLVLGAASRVATRLSLRSLAGSY